MSFTTAAELLGHDRVLLFLVLAIAVLSTTAVLFAAATLTLRLRNDLKQRRWQRVEKKWESILLEVLVEDRRPDDLADQVGPGEEVSFLSYLLGYSRLVTGREREIVDGLACRFLDHVIPHIRSRIAERRARAVQMLGELGLPQFSRPVIEALDDRSSLVAMIAATTLMVRPSEEFSRAVLAKLDRFIAWRPTYLAALVAAPGPMAGPRLRATLADHNRSPGVRRVAAVALTYLNDHRAAAPAYSVITRETDRDLVASCLRLLCQIGHADHLPGVRALLDSPDEVLRGAAAKALGSLGNQEDRERLHRAAVSDPSNWVALSAARALLASHGAGLLEKLAASHTARSQLAVQVLTEGQVS